MVVLLMVEEEDLVSHDHVLQGGGQVELEVSAYLRFTGQVSCVFLKCLQLLYQINYRHFVTGGL